MFKIFFIIIFIAELIIAVALIRKIWVFDKQVRAINDFLCVCKPDIESLLSSIRVLVAELFENIQEAKELIRQKKQEYIIKTVKNVIAYAAILFLRGKYKKPIIAYQFLSEIYEIIEEAV